MTEEATMVYAILKDTAKSFVGGLVLGKMIPTLGGR